MAKPTSQVGSLYKSGLVLLMGMALAGCQGQAPPPLPTASPTISQSVGQTTLATAQAALSKRDFKEALMHGKLARDLLRSEKAGSDVLFQADLLVADSYLGVKDYTNAKQLYQSLMASKPGPELKTKLESARRSEQDLFKREKERKRQKAVAGARQQVKNAETELAAGNLPQASRLASAALPFLTQSQDAPVGHLPRQVLSKTRQQIQAKLAAENQAYLNQRSRVPIGYREIPTYRERGYQRSAISGPEYVDMRLAFDEPTNATLIVEAKGMAYLRAAGRGEVKLPVLRANIREIVRKKEEPFRRKR